MNRTKETNNWYVAQTVKNPATMQETQTQFPGWEDHQDKEVTTHSSIPAWGTPWTEKPGFSPWATVHGVTLSDPTEHLTLTLENFQILTKTIF